MQEKILHDIGTEDFTINPVDGGSVVGDISGATGVVNSLLSSSMTVTWDSGVFASGETVTAGGNVSTSALGVISASFTGRLNRIVVQKNGMGAGANVPSSSAIHQWTVGGILGIETAKGGNFGASAAGFRIFDDLESPTLGFRWGLNGATNELEIFNQAGTKVYQITTGGISQNVTHKATASLQTPAIFIDTVPASGSSPKILSGIGSPEGVISAGGGSMYLNKSGGAGVTLFVKESGGSGNTGWVGK